MNDETTPETEPTDIPDIPAAPERSPAAPQIPVRPVDTARCDSCGATIDVQGIEPFSRVACPACGAEREVPGRFAHFMLLRHLGTGGMGTTFLAEDEQLGRRVAVKVIRNRLEAGSAAFETFKNEAQSAARLNHPHVAQVYSFGQEDGCPYLEMELVPGGDLAQFIVGGSTLDPAFVLRVGLEIAEGLKAAEEVGLFHGDVKPDNILFDENMGAKLVDFGIASRASQGAAGELWGTPFYIAPEKVQKKMNSARSDIYSLGATLYHAIAGKPPYDGEDAIAVIKARFKGPPPPVETFRPDIEPEVSRILSRMMYNDLFMRYPNYTSLIGDLKKYLAGVSDLRKQGPRTAAARAAAATGSFKPESAAPAAAPGGKKKFVIQRGQMEAAEARKEMEAAAPGASDGSKKKVLRLGGAGASSPSPADRQDAAADAAAKPDKSKKKGCGCSAKVVVFVVAAFLGLLVLGIVGGIVVFIRANQAANQLVERTKRDISEMEAEYFKAADEVEPLLAAAKARDAAMLKEFKPIEDLVKKAFDATFEIPDLEPPPEPEEEEPEFSAPESEEAADAPQEAPAPKKAQKKRPKPALTQYAEAYVEQRGGDVASVMDMLRQEARAAGKEPEEWAREKLGDGYDDGTGDDEEEAAGAEAPAGLDAMARQPGDAIADAAGQAAGAVGDAARQIVAAAPLAASIEQKVLVHARDVRAALRQCEAIASDELPTFSADRDNLPLEELLVARAVREAAWAARTNQIAQLRTRLERMDRSTREMKRGVARVVQEGQRYVRERERKLAEEAAAEAARQEELRKQEEAEAAAARGADEAARVREVAGTRQDLLDKFDYDTFVERMKRMETELTTPEGQEELKWTLARVERVKALRKWIVEDLRKNGEVQRGFRGRMVSGVSPDSKKLVVNLMPDFPIEKMTVADWVVLARALLENRRPERGGITPSEHGEMLFNTAVFAYLHGHGDVGALMLSKNLAKRAVEMRAGLRADAAKLLPLAAEEEEEEGTPSDAAAALDF